MHLGIVERAMMVSASGFNFDASAVPRIARAALPLVAVLLAVLGPTAGSRADDAVPAEAGPRWWKGNLHTHTFWSDGNDFPEMAAEWYRTHGYHFLALSDHNVLARGVRWMPEKTVLARGGADVIEKYLARFGASWVERRGEGDTAEVRLKPFDEFRALLEERGRFLMLPAEEISDRAEGVPVHLNASNIESAIQPVGGRTVSEAIQNNLRAVHEQAEKAGREILAHLNHPNYQYAVTPHALAHATLERHFEVFNGHPSVNQQGDADHPSVDRMWDIANTIRLVELAAPPLYGIATDDTHDYHTGPGDRQSSRAGRGWVMVRAIHLSPEHIVRAIKAGDCYASSGVTLEDVRFDEDSRTLAIDIAPAGDATFTTRFIGSFDTRRIGEVLATVEGRSARHTLTGRELYVRAIVTSSEPPADPVYEGQRAQAWTQPVGWSTAAAVSPAESRTGDTRAPDGSEAPPRGQRPEEAAGASPGDGRPTVAIVIAESEYGTEKTLPAFAERHLGERFRVVVHHAAVDDPHSIPGLERLEEADVLLLSVRRRGLTPAQMRSLRQWIAGGRPIVAIRTASHAWEPRDAPADRESWPEFDRDVLGVDYSGHFANDAASTVSWKPSGGAVLTGLTGSIPQVGSLYRIAPASGRTRVLAVAAIDGEPPQPVVTSFTRPDGGLSLYTSLGHREDLARPEVARLLVNALHVAVGRAPAAEGSKPPAAGDDRDPPDSGRAR
jgi:hypothetical protein